MAPPYRSPASYRQRFAPLVHRAHDEHVDVAIDSRGVPKEAATAAYRILQEALNNIVKHAKADRVRIRLDRVDDVLHLLIEDNGCGFDPGSITWVEGQCRGLGLFSMKERATFSGGVYRLVSTPGQGTRIEVSWPCS